MKNKDLANLLNRAAAVIEEPDSETGDEKDNLVRDLIYQAHLLEKKPETFDPNDPIVAPVKPEETAPARPSAHVLTRGLGTDIPKPRSRCTCHGDGFVQSKFCPVHGTEK